MISWYGIVKSVDKYNKKFKLGENLPIWQTGERSETSEDQQKKKRNKEKCGMIKLKKDTYLGVV